jgi:large subunit ribosomal protein L29
MKAIDLRKMTDEDIVNELLSIRKAQFSLKIQLATQQSGNTSQLKMMRKDVARIKTILHERLSAQ